MSEILYTIKKGLYLTKIVKQQIPHLLSIHPALLFKNREDAELCLINYNMLNVIKIPQITEIDVSTLKYSYQTYDKKLKK
jgi:hypothetical protein